MHSATAILAADVLLRKGDEVLLERRGNTVFAAGQYDIPGGHVEPGESVTAAAVRELQEEMGIAIAEEDLKLIHVLGRITGGDGKRRVNFEFECRKWKGEPQIKEPEKCSELRWVPLTQPPKNMVSHSAHVIDQYLKHRAWSELP